ncbi:MAG: glycosyltransferase [Bacteroidota bacterium]
MAYELQTFKDVTLLITHFNRSNSLERLFKNFSDLNIIFGEIIVSDDASSEIHLEHLRNLQNVYIFKLLTTPINKGLANNINKGQDAVTTPYTLYVQEDFVPCMKFKNGFKNAKEFMDQDSSIDISRFYAYLRYPYLKPYSRGFSLMLYKPWYTNTNKIYHYSDHPHLRRRNFFDRFGRYVEGIKSDKAEYEMSISFIRNKGKALFFDEFKSLFTQENSSDEPSTVRRNELRMSNGILISSIRTVYRQIKFNYDLHLRPKN